MKFLIVLACCARSNVWNPDRVALPGTAGDVMNGHFFLRQKFLALSLIFFLENSGLLNFSGKQVDRTVFFNDSKIPETKATGKLDAETISSMDLRHGRTRKEVRRKILRTKASSNYTKSPLPVLMTIKFL